MSWSSVHCFGTVTAIITVWLILAFIVEVIFVTITTSVCGQICEDTLGAKGSNCARRSPLSYSSF